MSIVFKNGNLFHSKTQTLVNAVNCVGVMGRGIALQFKNRYPSMFNSYKNICRQNLLEPGKLQLYKAADHWILNFPTKIHWKDKSELSYIEEGLKKFVDTYEAKGITSVAFPKLGCANGGLDWNTQVKPLMIKYLSALDNLHIEIYE